VYVGIYFGILLGVLDHLISIFSMEAAYQFTQWTSSKLLKPK